MAMETLNVQNNDCSLEQELAVKADVLDAQRKQREVEMVDIVLDHIAGGVVSKETDIMGLMASGNKNLNQGLKVIVIHEILRAADGLLWCPMYDEKLKSNQQVRLYTGSHWEFIPLQRFKDFVDDCAERCGVSELQRMSPPFMTSLYEAVAFNVAESRSQHVPEDETWINLKNGTLVIKADGSATMREHRKEDLFTYTLSYAYDASATCPQWLRFLGRVLPEESLREVLREFISYCFRKGHELEVMMMFLGGGLNGKSVTLEIIEALLGSMNVSYLSLADLTNDDKKRVCIEDKMLNISHESGKEVNPNVLKQLTSGEQVIVKHLYRDSYATANYGKLVAAFNELPRAENTFGFFRRLIILPYEVTIPKEEIDRDLASKLKQELSGILNWVLVALPRLMSRKEFTHSEKCEQAMERYRLQSDNVKLFLNEECETSDSLIKGKELYNAYCNYCRSSQLKSLSKKKFYERLNRHGFKPQMHGNMIYFNLRIVEE